MEKTMNDEQTRKMKDALAFAFDKAAVHCFTADSAAEHILRLLKDRGFTVTPLKRSK